MRSLDAFRSYNLHTVNTPARTLLFNLHGEPSVPIRTEAGWYRYQSPVLPLLVERIYD